MQNAHNLAKASLQSLSDSTGSKMSEKPQPVSTEPPAAHMRRLWERMVAIYGHKWTSTHGVTPHDESSGALTVAGETWQQGLRGVDGRHFGRGIEACIVGNDEWPPALPAFRAMCLGVPTFGSIRNSVMNLAARRHGEPAPAATPFARLVWQYIDGYRFRQVAVEQSDRMLKEAYEQAREHVMRGGELPEIVAEVEHVKAPRKPADPAKVAEALEAIRRALKDADE